MEPSIRTAIVYIIGFPNGKLYVGQTIQGLLRRFRRHKWSDEPCGRAIRKYGPENCRLIAVATELSESEADDIERFWIKELHAHGPSGYNLTDGGEGTLGRSASRRQRHAASKNLYQQWANREKMLAIQRIAVTKSAENLRGKKLTGERLENIRTAAARSAENRRGKKLSPEHRAKVLAALARRTRAGRRARGTC